MTVYLREKTLICQQIWKFAENIFYTFYEGAHDQASIHL